MGEVTLFVAAPRFRLVPPERELTLSERLSVAHDLVARAEFPLRSDNDPTSGFTLLARCAVICACRVGNPDDVADWAERLAAELRNPLGPAA